MKPFLLALVLPWLILSCSNDQPEEKQLSKIILMTDWYPQPEHGGFYQALAQGYYEAEGLEVEIRSGANLMDIRSPVALGQIDFAIGTSDTTLIGVGRGLPLVGMFPYFQHDPQCVMFHPENDIKTLYDLSDRTVMLQSSLSYTEHMIKSLKIDMNLIPMDYSLARFATDPEFIQQCFVTSEPIHLKKQGVEAKVIMLSESGFDPYRHIYTSKKTLQTKRAEAEAFTRASIKGWQEFMNGDPTPAFNLIASLNQQQTPELMKAGLAAMKKYAIVAGDSSKGESLGAYQKSRLHAQYQQLDELNLLDQSFNVDEYFDLTLLPQSD
ncbi:ABC transporter substrate-binding protein [Gayadomonas joobiniege]|uniref:ABC transporter substrate-binding protein n=1 Tax=Gayadomonas joobiniege TaxID=1234606 RepID=UPI00035FAC7C|nr:ABC transporter substrate-binding protein [Gayadomonas joobiniege]